MVHRSWKPSCLAALILLAAAFAADAVPVEKPRLSPLHDNQPLAFEENRGQTDPRVKYLSRGQGYTLFLTPAEAVLALHGVGKNNPGSVLRMRWAGGAPDPRVTADGPLSGVTHYLTGNDPSRWRTGVPSWTRVHYDEVWPGVGLAFYGNPRQLEHDFVIAPGADPSAIRLEILGAERIEIDAAGDLVLAVDREEIRLRRPVSYQEAGGERRAVVSGYRLLASAGSLVPQIGFNVAGHDPTQPLVIDPVLVYSTYLGGRYHDEGMGIAADAAGNAYVAGYATSHFPGTEGERLQGGWDAFVAKLDTDGDLVFFTFLGGSYIEQAQGIALDGAGNIYLAGHTGSTDFPRVNALPLPAREFSLGDAFVTKLDPTGSQILYSTRLGGGMPDEAVSIAVDAAGHAYVVGHTSSADFPTVRPIQPYRNFPHPGDLFISKLSPEGSSLVYSTLLGGSSYERATGIAVDPSGHATITGRTESADFPYVNAPPPRPLSVLGIVAKLAPSGSSLIYSRSLGNVVNAVAMDATGHAYVTGLAFSAEVPLVNPLQATRAGWSDAFVSRLGPAGGLVFSTYLGGSQEDEGRGIALDPAGHVWVTGDTFSPDFPLRDPLQTACTAYYCGADGFVVKLNAAASEILFSTLFGGSVGVEGDYEPSEPNDVPLAIATDRRGNAFITGWTFSTDLPIINAVQPQHAESADYGGTTDAFVAKIASDNQPPDCSTALASPSVIWPPNGQMVPISITGVTDPDGDSITLAITGITQDEPSTGRTPDASGAGTSTAQVRASRAGGGDGRVYHIIFSAADSAGASCTGTVAVCVPHDRGRGSTCGDGGALFDSIRR